MLKYPHTSLRPGRPMRATLLACGILALAAIPWVGTADDATPIPDSVYRIVATHADWGTGSGWMWGDPQLGMHMWLSGTFGDAEFGYTIGGEQYEFPTSSGTIVVDRWISSGTGRFVGAYLDDADTQEGPALGGGRLEGWAITVLSHT